MAKVLAAASGGGHWEQLILLVDDLAGHDIAYATSNIDQAEFSGIASALPLPDCNLDQPIRALACAWESFRLVNRIRPDVVISTGAAPGFFCIFWGQLFCARTLWIDSVANAEKLSLSGRLAKRIGARCLTQWEHLAKPGDVDFAGSVL